MSGQAKDLSRLEHILEAINYLESYVNDHGRTDFEEYHMVLFASVKQLEIIGEAINQLSDDCKAHISVVDIRQIISMRNFLVHEYFGISPGIVWDTVDKDVPQLKEIVEELIKSVEEE